MQAGARFSSQKALQIGDRTHAYKRVSNAKAENGVF